MEKTLLDVTLELALREKETIELLEEDKIRKFSKNIFADKKKSVEEHSFFMDEFLQIRSSEVEKSLLQKYKHFKSRSSSDKLNIKSQSWVGLCPQVLQTPFSEIHDAFKTIEQFDIQSVVDFGAGYGRVAYVSKTFFPLSTFLGYEIIEERVIEGLNAYKANNLKDCGLIQDDILSRDFVFPKANLYFLYDFSDAKDLIIFFERFIPFFEKQNSFLVLRGKGARALIQKDYPRIWQPYGVIHKENWSIYSSFFDLDRLK